LEELNGLLSKVKITEKQAQRRDELLEKRDAPPTLSQGAKSYLQELWTEKTFGRYKEVDTKYMQKGTQEECNALIMADEVLGWNLGKDFIEGIEFRKNRLSNDWITGETDLNTEDLLADVKSPWDLFTFPFFDEKIPTDSYFWQGQGYMMLTGHTKFELVYVLVNTPENLICDEIRRYEWKQNYIEIPEDEEVKIRHRMIFDDIEDKHKVRRWIVERDEKALARIRMCVKLSREYLKELNNQFKINFK
jgi:hypothetical protein